MKRTGFLILIFTLVIAGCKSSPETRRTISASGNPEDIFFERTGEDVHDPVAKSVKEDLDPSKVTRYDIPEKKADISGNFDEIGYSSWYGARYQGKPTASGEPFDSNKLTAAHRTLPMGSIVKVQNLENNRETTVRVNDRGPFVEGRIIDVSEKAADLLDFKDKGIAKVGLKVVKKGDSGQNFEELDDGSMDEDLDIPEMDSPAKPIPSKDLPIAAPPSSNRPRGFTVQVGVFRDPARAEKYKAFMAREYKEKVFLYSRSDGFVVQMGDFATRDEAERLKARLKYDGIDCFIPPK